METQAIFIYCLAEAVLNACHVEDDRQSVMSSAEVVTFTLISALFYGCNFRLTRFVIKPQCYFPKILSRSRLIRRIHKIPEHVWQVMFVICRNSLSRKGSAEFIIDSFPIAICQNHKIFRCKLFTDNTYRGYTASKKSYFFGIKVHMLVNLEGIPVEFHFTRGSTSDVKALKDFSLDLGKNAKIYADRAYNDYQYEDLLMESAKIKLIPKRKKNSHRKNHRADEFCLSLYRNRIETTFSCIRALMPNCIRAKTPKGFFLKVFFFILGFMVKRLAPLN